MTQLDWYPHSPARWEEICEGLSLLERGALQKVLDASWLRTPAGTIANTEAELQLLLGPDWKKVAPMIRRHFTPDLEHPGRLRCVWFAEMHHVQMVKYTKRADAGGRGGNYKAAHRKLASEKGQGDLTKPPSNARPRRANSPSIATASLGQTVPAALAMLEQKLDSSLRTRTGDAVAVASSAPASPDSWTGPDFDQLRTWADGDPEIAHAVDARVAALVQHIPAGVQVPALRRLHETDALRAEFLARQAIAPAGGVE